MTALPPLPASAAPAATAVGPSASGAGPGGFLEMLLAAVSGDLDADAEGDPQAETEGQAETEEVLPVPFATTPPAPVVATLPSPPAAVTEAVRLAEAPALTTTDATGTGTGTEPRTDEPGVRTLPLPGPAAAPQDGALSVPVTMTTPTDAGADPSLHLVQGASGREIPTAAAPGVPASPASSASSAPGIDVSAMTPVHATAPALPTASAASAATATPVAAPPVADQVFGEVSRLVSRGDGTHRLTMTLSPEALGDVRVTLTVRNGEVTVDFAAGDEARRALLESAPELRRLLELTGASESRVTVRDGAGSGTAPGAGQAHDGPATSGRGSDDPRRDQDHHAGTRAGENAMDGNHRGPGDTRLPHDPVRSTRAAGLDLTL